MKTTTSNAGTQTDAAAPSAPRYSKSGHDITSLTKARIDELARKLTPEEAQVILAKGTERAFCGTLTDNKKEGVYICRLCSLPLFSSGHKFHSGTGWPSFFQPVDAAHVATERDESFGMVRDEILCARCGSHLGHVFDDGPRPTGLRFCVNSVSLEFVEKGQDLPKAARPVATESAYFAGGCFWGIEHWFEQTPGVIDAESGYMGGRTLNPTYKQVCYEDTGHAEVVKVTFDPARVTFAELLKVFFKIHDPTQLNRQGPDVGDQYRTAIFAATPAQAETARAFIADQQKNNARFAGRTIVTRVIDAGKDGPADPYYKAEDYHQDYHAKHGGHCPLPER
ncbi:MAG: bifunctional methionine sulfoxide reductase B/A protein [Phycisphaerales bacterium]